MSQLETSEMIDRVIAAAYEYLNKGGQHRLDSYNILARQLTDRLAPDVPTARRLAPVIPIRPPQPKPFVFVAPTFVIKPVIEEPELDPAKEVENTSFGPGEAVNIYDPGANWAGVDALYDWDLECVGVGKSQKRMMKAL